MDYNMKEIYFQEELDLLYEGIEDLSKAVASTLGPNGSTVILTGENGEPYITKDGVSVARGVFFKDPVKNMGAKLVKQAAEKTLEKAGDGTSTSIVLSNKLIQNLKTFHYKEINTALDKLIPKVINHLEENSKSLDRGDIKHVAKISANGDSSIGDILQQAFNFSDIVRAEQSQQISDSLETINGMSLDVSYFSKHFVNKPKNREYYAKEPFVLILKCKLHNIHNLQNVITSCVNKGKPLLIITEHVEDKDLRILENLVLSEAADLCVMKTPGFSSFRQDLIQDLSKYTGAIPLDNLINPAPLTSLGILESCSITNIRSVLTKHPEIDITELISNLESQKKSAADSYDAELLQKRIDNLKGKVAVIKVGGVSEIEMKERYDRYDDSIRAVGCALEEGVVEGAGVALYKACEYVRSQVNLEVEHKILDSLSEPYNIIGFTPKGSLFEYDIIDPLKVTKTALKNATSVAKTILSTKVVINGNLRWN